jgi:hypothetical protein
MKFLKYHFTIILLLIVFIDAKGQTYNCKFVSESNFGSDLKPSKSIINIDSNKAEISISNFLNGGVEPLILSIDSIVYKEHNYINSKWYYCHSDRKDIVIVPPGRNSVYLYDFADEVTIFQYVFTYSK